MSLGIDKAWPLFCRLAFFMWNQTLEDGIERIMKRERTSYFVSFYRQERAKDRYREVSIGLANQIIIYVCIKCLLMIISRIYDLFFISFYYKVIFHCNQLYRGLVKINRCPLRLSRAWTTDSGLSTGIGSGRKTCFTTVIFQVERRAFGEQVPPP